MFARINDLLGMIKFSHTLFALPFAIFGAALAARGPNGWQTSARDWLAIILCMASARSAAMSFNRLADRHIDAANPRTASRHLPTGRLSTPSVAVFTFVCALGFVASTLLFLPRNPWPLWLSVPVLLWIFAYSYTKRFTSLSHFWLGSALMLAPIAAWIAIRGDLAWPPVFLGLAVLCWVSGFDIIYACQDVNFDREAGLHSLPARIGVARSLPLAALCHALMIAALVGLGVSYPLGALYYAGVGIVAVLLIYEHALVRPDDLTRVNRAFFQVNIAISLALMVVGVADMLLD
jgi:4-hydroxybenzoate polyprenyltransferase